MHHNNIECLSLMYGKCVLHTTRFIRRLQQEAHEQEMQERIIAAERERVLKQKQLAQEERLAQELERLKWEQQKDERIRQQIKENRYTVCTLVVRSGGSGRREGDNLECTEDQLYRLPQ